MRATAVLATGMLLAAGVARAQDASLDPRWLPWIGCWERLPDAIPESRAAVPVVCVLPAATTSTVEIVTVASGAVVARDSVDASGARRDIDKDGCIGWETVTWAADGRRLYRNVELDCQGGLHQVASQLLAISPAGAWIHVQGVIVAERTGLRVSRYREADPATALPDDVAAAVRGRSEVAKLARIAAGAPVTTTDVVEASRAVHATVVQAWLAEQEQGFALNSRLLAELSQQGLPSGVIDIMVALSYPRAFTVDRASASVELRSDSIRGGSWNAGYGVLAPTSYGYYRYEDYGCDFGSWRTWCDRWYWGDRPIIVEQAGQTHGGVAGQSLAGGSHGSVVNGRGYQAGSGSATTSQAHPRERAEPEAAAPTQQPAGSVSSGAGGTSSPPGSGERTAKPRP